MTDLRRAIILKLLVGESYASIVQTDLFPDFLGKHFLSEILKYCIFF